MMQEVIPGLEGIPIAESSVSFVDGQAGRLEYRGIGVEELAEHSHFEETSWLLLRGTLPSKAELQTFKAELAEHQKLHNGVIDLIRCLPETGHPMDALQAAVAGIGMFYPRPDLADVEARRVACCRLIAKLPTVVAAFKRLRAGDEPIAPQADMGLAANFLYMMNGSKPDPMQVKIIDVCLILHADHTMNASTFAGRVVGSTLADPYTVVSSALGALSGPLHGGANEDAIRLFERIGTADNARSVIENMIERKEKIPGFGHRVYKTMDPRAKILKVYAAELAKQSGSPLFEIALEVEKVGTERYGAKGIYPNVDFFSGIVYRALQIPQDCFTPVFAMARVSGWLAHWLEQLEHNRIFRPTQKYVGKHNQPYTPPA